MSIKGRVHPEYAARAPYWKFLRASYLGGEEWAAQGPTWRYDVFEENTAGVHRVSRVESCNLWRHPREEDSEYSARMRMASYANFCEPFVKTQVRAVVRDIQGPEFPSQLSFFAGDVDRRGTSLAAFRDALFSWAVVYGHAFVLVDRPSYTGEALSVAQESAAGLRTYLQLITPLDLLDWEWNEEAQAFNWVKLRVRTPAKRSPSGEERQEQYCRLITPTEWVTLCGDTVVESGPGFGFVPLVPVFADRDPMQPEPIGTSLIRDVAYLARAAYNKLSWLTEEEAAHCFSMLAINTPDKPPPDARRTIGVSRYLFVQGSASYIAPSVEPMKHLLTSMEADAQRAKMALGVEASPDGPVGGETATALVLRREGMDAILSGLSSQFESAERAVWSTVARVEGLDWTPELSYRKDFTSLSKAQRVTVILDAIARGGFQGPALAALQREALLGLLPGMTPEALAEVEEGLGASEPIPDMAKPEEVPDMGGPLGKLGR